MTHESDRSTGDYHCRDYRTLAKIVIMIEYVAEKYVTGDLQTRFTSAVSEDVCAFY